MSKSTKARVFVPLMKVDEEQRLVFGKITAQEVDQSGEMMDYDSSKPNFESWSAQIEEGSGGLSKGNLRVMHGLSVAGKLTDLTFNDDDKSIEVCAKVVDDAEWNKVIEGCYTGFSVGGKYGKKWKETVDGETITKFTAIPNEVSIVDNPCVKSATFMLSKADGAEEIVHFSDAVATIDPDDTDTGGEGTDGPDAKVEKTVTDDHQVPTAGEPSATAIAEKAGELAKAANDGTTWQDHIEAARQDLMKGETSALNAVVDQQREAAEDAGTGEAKTSSEKTEPERGSDDPSSDDDAGGSEGDAVEKTTPPGVKQLWAASDGETFEKKADCVAHEEKLQKEAAPKTEAEKLRERLAKATNPEEDAPEAEVGLMEDFDRLSKVVSALSTPMVDGAPKLEKGMYTINRFSSVLSDMASLSRSIKAEGQKEGGEASDATVSADIIGAVKTLGASFITYATEQVQELLAGMDDDVVVGYYDYYYNAAQVDPEDGLAKDVCSVVNDLREPSRETRETLAKSFGYVEGELEVTEDDVLSPPMQKRFDALESENKELKKVAEEAVETVEKLTKRVETIENTPLPRAPGSIALRPGDNSFFGKTAGTEEEKIAILHDMIKTRGADAVALDLIKLSHQNPVRMGLPGQ